MLLKEKLKIPAESLMLSSINGPIQILIKGQNFVSIICTKKIPVKITPPHIHMLCQPHTYINVLNGHRVCTITICLNTGFLLDQGLIQAILDTDHQYIILRFLKMKKFKK